jgi:type IV secretory pathway VirB6-like protein
MSPFIRILSASLFFAVPAYSAYAQSAIAADLAKKCREQAVKAHPTPKAGTKASGVEKAQRDAFQACVSKGADNK